MCSLEKYHLKITIIIIINSVRLHGYVLRREDGYVLRWVLDFEVEGQRKKGRPKRIRGRSKKKVLRLVCERMMPFADQSGVLVLIRLLLG